ncbi:MAG: polysaccharide deacetylase family protein [Solirubrobacteraceae bacterium]
MNPALVLCYHAVSPTWESDLSVAPDALERQVDHLLRRGWRPTTFTDAILGPRDRRAFAITFDDAFATVRSYAAPVLREFGVRGTLFAPTSYLDGGGTLSWTGIASWHDTAQANELRALTWDQVGELAEYGWEIGSHTHSHPCLTQLSDDAIREELSVSRDELTRRLGRRCESIAYPYGDVDERVEGLTREAGYRTAAALPGSFTHLNVHRYPRLGLYHRDGALRFWLKVARGTRLLGLSRSTAR